MKIIRFIVMAALLSACQIPKKGADTGVLQEFDQPAAFGKNKDYYNAHPVFNPIVKKEGTLVRFCTPAGAPTGIYYDSTKLLDVDEHKPSEYAIATFESGMKLDYAEKIINEAIRGVFHDGYYADFEDKINSPAGQELLSKARIGKPVTIAVRSRGTTEELYQVPLIIEGKIVAIATVAKETGGEISGCEFLITRETPSELPKDGIIPFFSKKTLLEEVSHGESSSKFKTQGLTEDSVNPKRVFVAAQPKISQGGIVWLLGEGQRSILMTHNGSLFVPESSIPTSRNSIQTNSPYRIKVRPL